MSQYDKDREFEYYRNHPERYLLKSAKQRARIRGLDFNIEENDIIIPDVCPIRGVSFDPVRSGHKNRDNVPSIDRKDVSKGYVKGNIFVISWLANKYKNEMSLEEIQNLYNYISS